MQALQQKKILIKRIPTHLLVAGSAWISRIITAAIQLVSVRILTDSLGTEKYAVFALLTGLLGWYMLADLGVGFSLQNFISENRSKQQPYDEYIAAATFVSLILLFATIIILYFISPHIAPIFLKSFPFMSEIEKVRNFFVVGTISLVATIGGISYKVWYGEQKGYLSNIFPAVASIVGFGAIWFIAKSNFDNKLFFMLFAFTMPTAAMAILCFMVKMGKFLVQSRKKISYQSLEKILKRSFQFWFFALMSAGVLQVDYLVMSQHISASDIVIYNISNRIFMLVFFIYNAVLMALWPIFAEKIAQNKWPSVIKYLKRYLFLGSSYMVVSIVLLAGLMPIIIQIISPNAHVYVPIAFILLLGLYQLIRVWTDTFAVVLQSMSDLKPFWIWVPIQAVLSITIQWLLAPHFGIYGIVLGLIASYVFTVVWALPRSVWRHFKYSKGFSS